jgi:zinc transport system substrate-binding protein
MRGRSIGLLLAGAAWIACSQQAAEPETGVREESGPLSVYTVSYPLAYFAERIGGEHVKVVFPAPPDIDPAHWSPDPETVAAYQDADLILLNGAGYAAWVQRASLPMATLVDTSAAFRDRLVVVEDAVTHGHGPRGAHTHEGTAFTTWLDPTLAREQARAISEALARARPDRAESFRDGLAALDSDLRNLDERLARIARTLGDAPLLFSHPVYQYLERRYGLKGRSLNWEPDRPPDDATWRDLATLLSDHPARIMVWEGEPLEGTARRLEELGLESVVFSPCGNAPGEGDWLATMRGNARRLEAAASERG